MLPREVRLTSDHLVLSLEGYLSGSLFSNNLNAGIITLTQVYVWGILNIPYPVVGSSSPSSAADGAPECVHVPAAEDCWSESVLHGV